MSSETITPSELSGLRDETEKWFTDICDVYRITDTEDTYGGEESSESILASGIPCMLESSTAHEQTRELYGVVRGTQLFTVTLPAYTDIRLNDHIVVTSQNNLHLRVQAVLNPESWEIERRVIGSEEGQHLL